MSTSNNNTTIKVSVDASGAEAGVNKLKSAATQATASMDAMRERQRLVTAAMQEAANNGFPITAREANKLAQQYQKLAETAGKSRVEILNQQAANKGVRDTFSSMGAEIAQASEHVHEFGLKSAASRRELIVLAHEASQGSWSKFGGSMMVLGEQVDAMRYLLSPLGIALGVAGGAAFLFFSKIHEGAKQVEEFNKAITSTGGFLGLSAEQMIAMSNGLQTAHESLSQVREAMAQVAATGAFTGDQLALATQAALAMASDIGIGTDKAAESLAKIQDDVMKWVTEYQRAHHTFSAAQIEEIDNFVKAGDTTSAYNAILRDLEGAHKVAEASGKQATNFIAQGWRDILEVVGMYKNAIMNIGVPAGITQQVGEQLARVEATQRSIADQRRMGNLAAARAAEAQLAVEQQKLAVLRDQQAVEFKSQKAKEAAAKSGDAKVAVNSYLGSTKYASPGDKKGLELEAEKQAFGKATKDLDKNSADYQAALKRHYANVQTIETEYAKKTRGKAPGEGAINARMADLRGQNTLLEAEAKRSEAVLKGQRDAGLIDAEDYFRGLHDIQAKLLDAEIANAEKRAAVAKGKKEQSAYETAHAEYLKLVEQRKKVDDDLTSSLEKHAKQRADGVAKYAKQQNEATQKAQAQYREAYDTRNMLPRDKAEYDARQKLHESFLIAGRALDEEFNSGKTDFEGWTEKRAIAQKGYDDQLSMLEANLQQQKQIRESYSEQFAQVFKGYAAQSQTNAELAATAFDTSFKDMSSALETFVTTGKLNFSSLASSILADLAKIALHAAEVQIFKSLGTSMGFFSEGGEVGHYADGGHISGAGTGTSDSIPAMLSNGEYVVKAAQAGKYRSLLEAINNGHMSHFATGGAVGSVPASTSGGSVTNLQMNLQAGGSNGLSQEDLIALAPLFQNLIDKRLAQRMNGQGGYGYKLKHGQM
jgi:lambda family phage tail tape measure protein